jgi:hypothetical protein
LLRALNRKSKAIDERLRVMSSKASILAMAMAACVESGTTSTSAPSTLASASASASATVSVAPPKEARVELGVRKSTHFLGENVLVDFCVVNGKDTPIKIDVGGDYRGSSRSLRFKVEVRDSTGVVMPDPDPDGYNLGGIGYSPDIAPGAKWCQSLPLMRYARIDAPGTYTITATHDLGWPAGTAPRGTTTIALAMPDATRAETIVREMEALPADPSTSAGQTAVAYQDFSAMRYDVYSAPLEARAKAGKAYAFDGLSQIPTTNATRALVALLAAPNADIAHAAAMALAMRLPDPALTGQLGARNPFENTLGAQRKYLSSHAWDASFTDDVRTAARARLSSPHSDVRELQDGAFMLEAVGHGSDAPPLVRALDTAIDRTRTVPAEKDVYPVPRGACQELLRAAEMLVARGATPLASPKSPGEIAMWLVALERQTTRPAGWEAVLASAMKHPIAYVRELAMIRVPAHALPPSLVALVATNLANADEDVVVEAAELARRENVRSLAPAIVAAMAHPVGLRLNIVSNAAHALGARMTRAKALAARLADKDAFDEALAELVETLDHQGRSTDGETTDAARAAVAARWRAFVEAHRADIQADRKLSLDDPTVTPDLVPPTWKLTRANGTDWP